MANEREPNNSRAAADQLTENQYTYGNLSNSSDDDFFKLSLNSAGKIEIDFLSPLSGEGFFQDFWYIRVYDNLGNTLNIDQKVSSGSFYTYVDKPGNYFIRIYQNDSFDLDTSEYGIKYSFTPGNYNVGFENNNSSTNASPIVIGSPIYGNLYNQFDDDWYTFNLPSYDDTIKVAYDLPPYSGTFFVDNFEIYLYDSAGNVLDGGEFADDGSFTVSTKSKGKFYILVDQDYGPDVSRNLYNLTVETSSSSGSGSSSSSTSSSSSSSSSSSTSSSSSSTSVLHLTGEGDDGLTVGSSGDDLYEVSKGRDDYDGNGGYDTLYDIPRGSTIVRGQDATGFYTGVINKKFIYIQEKKPDGTFDDSYTAAWEVEGIQYEDSDITYNISSFNSTNYFLLRSNDFSDQNLNNNQSATVDMSSKFWTNNEGGSISFSFSSSNSALTDQISQSGSNLTISSGSSGPKVSTTITVTASETSINRSSPQTKTETFTVTMTDDDYSGSSREREPNDLYDQAIALDPNYNTQKFTSATYSSENIITANLSSKGDYDRYWVNLDQNETIIIKFDQVYNAGTEKSYKIYFVRESTGDVFKTSTTEAGYIYTIPFKAPSEGVYHVVVTANSGEESYEGRDYEISIDSFDDPTTQSSSNFLDLNSDYDSYSDPIKGTSASETVSGTNQRETIDSFEGDDIINAGKGADTIDGGEGNDTINAGNGRDDIYVSNGIDLINGGPGIDTLTIPDDSWTVLRGLDRLGTFFSKDTEYIYVASPDGNSVSRASNIEKISIYKLDSDGNQVWGNTNSTDSTFSVRTFDYDSNYWYIKKLDTIGDINIPYKGFATVDASNVNINLGDYFAAENYGYDVKYSITSPTSTDYLSISGDILTINARSDVYETVPVTISARNLKPNGSTISNDEPLEQTFYITFAPDIIGDDGDNEIDGTSGDDIYNVTDGFDVIDGKSGTDTIVIPYNGTAKEWFLNNLNITKDEREYHEEFSNYNVSKAIDIDGSVTGIINQEFLYIYKIFDPSSDLFGGNPFLDENYILLNDGDKYINMTIAYNFEKIYFENTLYDYDSFKTFSWMGLNEIPSTNFLSKGSSFNKPKNLEDQVIENSSTKIIDLDNYYTNANPGIDITYTLSSDSDKLSDQITLNDSKITIIAGNQGDLVTSTVTVKASLKYDSTKVVYSQDRWELYAEGGSDYSYDSELQEARTLTFLVKMRDDDADPQTYSLDSSSTNVEEGVIISFTLKSSSNVSEDINLTWEVASAKNFNSLDETSDNDINPVSGTITILSGSSSSSFEVKINSDNLLENDESFKINILDSNSEIIASDIIIVRDVNNLGYELSVEKNENGPDLKEFSDTYNNRGTLNHTVNNEIIVITGQAGTIRGLRGDDVYLVSNLITSDAKIQITDTDGNNTIEIPDNTLITKALFASNATKLTLGNNQEITITSADKFSYNVSGNISNGDIGKSLTYAEFANIFGIELSDETQEVEKNYYMKSDAVSESSFNIINISGTDDATIFATNDADEFRYEVNNDGTSAEGPYSFEIEGFDKTNDKLVLVNKTGNNILTTQEFDAKDNVEVTSDGIVGTQILFAPDSSGQSGKLTIKEINEQFSNNWTAESYLVEIKPVSQLTSSNSLSETSYTFSDTPNLSKPVLSEFNSSISNGILNYSDQNDIIILNGSGKTAAGKSGDDLYIISDLIPKNGKIQITDTIGSNIIQIPDNTYIDDTLFTKNATRLTLKDGREVTISDADEFTYNLGANITAGDEGLDLSYQEFASAFGVEDVLSLSSSVNGTIVDQYII